MHDRKTKSACQYYFNRFIRYLGKYLFDICLFSKQLRFSGKLTVIAFWRVILLLPSSYLSMTSIGFEYSGSGGGDGDDITLFCNLFSLVQVGSWM
mmetsp:Transcript_15108/g.18946  ORF Transcript_15108/g.18946 Transcript_15108/m.18946 type:complete len:95 (-) Transcript_15108:83-367(-)